MSSEPRGRQPFGVAFSLKPKGMVHSPIHRGVRISKAMREQGKGVLEIFPQFIQGMAGLTVGCQAWLLTYRASVDPGGSPTTDREPPSIRDVLADPALRVVHSIGIDQVTILGIEGLMLQVEGLEAEDGSPVLDIQPVKDPCRP